MHELHRLIVTLALGALAGCSGVTVVDGDGDSDADIDGDADSDGDIDTDVERDIDEVEADADADTGCATDEDCADGRFCNGEERCVDGECLPGEPPVCDDGDPCTDDRCPLHYPRCLFTPRDQDQDDHPDGACGWRILGWDDCDDSDPLIHPGAEERCNGLDDDCDGEVDEGDLDGDGLTVCEDEDNDGDGTPDDLDCDPFNPDAFPGNYEGCNGFDDNCDGEVDEGCACADGWAWENPLPQGHSLYGAWYAPDGSAFLVGSYGTILHYVDGEFIEMESGVPDDLSGVWGTAADDVFAVGGLGVADWSTGIILHYDGTSWTRMDSGGSKWLWDVWGSAPDDVYAVGYFFGFLHYDGTRWRHIEPEGQGGGYKVWGTSSDDVYINATYAVYHFDGENWEEMDNIAWDGCAMSDLWTDPEGELFFGVGWCRGMSGAIWQGRVDGYIRRVDVGSISALNAIWATSTHNVYAVGLNCIMRYDGESWEETHVPVEQDLYDIDGTSRDNIIVTGTAGTILHFDGETWQRLSEGSTASLIYVWGSSHDDIYVIGDHAVWTEPSFWPDHWESVVLHFDGFQWEEVPLEVDFSQAGSVWGTSREDVYITGNMPSVVLRYNGIDWHPMDVPESYFLYSMWGTSNRDIFAVSAVGDDSVILHYDGVHWTEMDSEFDQSLRYVWGSSSSDVFITARTSILHYNGDRWEDTHPLCSDRYYCDYVDIWGTSSYNVYAVKFSASNNGSLIHYNGTRWNDLVIGYGFRNGFMDVWGTSSRNVFAVNSTSIWYYNGETWRRIETGASVGAANIWGTLPNNVYIIGHFGNIIHRCGEGWLEE